MITVLNPFGTPPERNNPYGPMGRGDYKNPNPVCPSWKECVWNNNPWDYNALVNFIIKSLDIP